ncbi:MAG: hypothetical protein ABIN48_11570, partial [Ginsengibacter sp.]
IESLKADQQKIIDNEKLYIIKIDSMRVKLEEMETAKIKIVERHYHTKEIIKQKIEQDEKFIDNLNTHPDTIRKYFTEYKYQPYIRTSN